ncbi:MAG: ABC transporter ATP-binding protein [Clostridia bacterium]|nr:ABC transporter ATP-binding protein [Clostridia bacterium]MBR5881047.1 ABC transporter ATP-binding protein [Clostridia bacterium]
MKIRDLRFSFADTVVFDGLDLDLADGKITAVMAPSGKGKSTLLRLIAGLLEPSSGSIDLGGRTVGMMFQEPRLFGQLTVLQNVMLVIKQKKDKRQRAMQLLEVFGLADAADKYPDELSGGMAKRVSLARAIAYDADILLLDEPFSALDAKTKDDVIAWTMQLVSGKTVILVTHDRFEAERFADVIVDLPQ